MKNIIDSGEPELKCAVYAVGRFFVKRNALRTNVPTAAFFVPN